MHTVKTLSIFSSSLLMLAACSSPPKPSVESTATPPAVVQATKPLPPAESRVQLVVVPPYLDPKNALSTDRSVYFDYDMFAVKSEYTAMLEMHGKYLAASSKLSIRVEGNADERGSAEYNLALGQKRAETVVRALKVYGVKEAQVEAISWGKEKPKAVGHTEAAFAQNRRVDLGYPMK